MSLERPIAGDVHRFDTNRSARVYRIACDAFPTLVANVYVVLGAGPPTLIDTSSGFGESNNQLLAGLTRVREEFGEPIDLQHIERIILTHGHIDHIGGLPFLHERMPHAQIMIHELDVRILTAYEERVAVATKAIRRFLQEAGVRADVLPQFMNLYGFSKKTNHRLPVAEALVDEKSMDGMRFIHTPGHCPGQVCIDLGNILISADHVLPEISPHQSPESIMPYTGLGHYLESLSKIARNPGFEIGLGGHRGAISNFYQRVEEIRQEHERKLVKIKAIIADSPEPITISEISAQLYTRVSGFHVLLALEETAAHVEYLYQHGKLAIANLADYQQEVDPPAIQYVVS